MSWHFDQGHLECFQFSELCGIAQGLLAHHAQLRPNASDDTLRQQLLAHSQLKFKAPKTHTVWRQYGRAFRLLMLASMNGNKIIATDLCKRLANQEIDPDDYWEYFARSYYSPSPALEDYRARGGRAYPVIAIIKLLLARQKSGLPATVSTEEVGEYLIANQVTGEEPISAYKKLSRQTYEKTAKNKAVLRQMSELMQVVSQLSFLEWKGSKLHLYTTSDEILKEIESIFVPIKHKRLADKDKETQALAARFAGGALGKTTRSEVEHAEPEFVEGRKLRAVHLRTERSSALKALFLRKKKDAHVCDMCVTDTKALYPWAENGVIDIHHLLPLSSPVHVSSHGNSIQDLVSLCPTCHRAIHRYYAIWLKKRGQEDFRDKVEARSVYQEAKASITRKTLSKTTTKIA